MKIRTGFVSNSSSSSFICDVCGTIQSGWSLDLADTDMIMCVNGHVFCSEHVEKPYGKKAIIEFLKDQAKKSPKRGSDSPAPDYEGFIERLKNMPDDEPYDYSTEESRKFGLYNLQEEYPESLCPVCQMKAFRDEEVMLYMIKRSGMTYNDVYDEIRRTMKDYKTFKAYIEDV